ncbi:hypothetical protein [Streptomyces cadmiisoli]|uniref:hypothetical protein n=1 Tax=Streptomyces cadmiisoli TaxID=2184053 RepID=UPI0013A6CF32
MIEGLGLCLDQQTALPLIEMWQNRHELRARDCPVASPACSCETDEPPVRRHEFKICTPQACYRQAGRDVGNPGWSGLPRGHRVDLAEF